MFGSNPQKTGLNTSQYDFKGVAVFPFLFRLSPLLVHINPLLQEQVETSELLLVVPSLIGE